ncbi:MAG: SGNH/GDSL hydrolase family protein [Coriobacteriales bacterium]|nr:SGNH/GDSL hydrolase family protein [Coriobacteriales bacterium]
MNLLFVVAMAMMMTACACSGDSTNNSSAISASKSAAEAPAPTGKPATQRLISCWGDSLTEGIGAGPAVIETAEQTIDVSFMSYPEILQQLTGITTLNYGMAGATSYEIAFLQRSLAQMREIDGINAVTNRDAKKMRDVIVLELGSNGGWDDDYDVLIDQYQEMIDLSGCDNYIIIGDTDDPGMSIADSDQEEPEHGHGTEDTQWEAALREAFGEHFIDMRVYLIEHGLEVCGLEPTEKDEEDAEDGYVSEQLRADWTHLNSYGYYAQARAVFEKGQELGYW